MNSEFKTPVAFLVYNRPEITARTFDEIRKIKPPILLVVADGPNPNRPGDVEKCNAVREIIQKGIDWNCKAVMNCATVNLGCKKRVSSGLDWVFQEVEEAIILEDDCLPDPSFFGYCQELLEYYRDNPKIMHISGNNFQFGRKRGEASYYFSRYNHIWGWASWRRAWKFYDVNMSGFSEFKAKNRIQQIFSTQTEQQYWTNIFETVYQGKVDTWDYQWTFAMWANDGLAVLSNVNLVSNIGFGQESLHTQHLSITANIKTEHLDHIIHPEIIECNNEADNFTLDHVFTLKSAPLIENEYLSLFFDYKNISCDNLTQKLMNYLNSGDNEKAILLAEKAIEANPDMIELNYGKAIALFRLEKMDEAINILQLLLSVKPTDEKAQTLFNEIATTSVSKWMAQAANELDTNRDRAFVLLNKAKSLRKHLQGLDYLRAICFLKMNQPDAAREALREELRYFPNNEQANNLMNQILEHYPQMAPRGIGDSEFQELLKLIRPYTMSSEERLYSLFSLAKEVCLKDIPGNFIECGVAAGGSTALLCYVIKRYTKRPRLHYAFDSFEGMPTPTEKDKHRNVDAEATGWGTGTCSSSEESVKTICERLQVTNILIPVKGYFEKTLPIMINKIGEIAFLHMDGDWYDSTKSILENLYDQLNNNALIQIDDYGHWDGCREAIHDFELLKNIHFELHHIDGTGVWCNKPLTNSKKSFKAVHLCMQDFGGAGKAAYRLNKSLQSVGVDSEMIVLNKHSGDPSVKVLPVDYPSSGGLTCPDIPRYDSPLWNNRSRRWGELLSRYPKRPPGLELFTDADSDVKLDRIREIYEADIVNFHWMSGIIDCSDLPLALGNKPVIWTLHDMNPFTGGCHYAGDCLKYKTACGACPQLGSDVENDLSRQIWEKKFNAYKDLNIHIVALSRWLANCAGESALFSRFPIHLIPNGFPTDIFKPYPNVKIQGIPETSKIILFGADYVGNERKGFRYLLEALNRLKNDNYVLLTFGNLPREVAISSRYPVMNAGSVSDENQLAMIYSAADVFVLPSLEDNLPNTVIEAMACGTPVVGFNIGGMPDMIEHKKTGFLVIPRDINGLAEGIEWVLSSGINFSEPCRKKVMENYTYEIQANSYKQLYEQILKSPVKKASLSKPMLLNLGCGNRYHREWTNVDIRSSCPEVKAHNLYAGIPFSDETFDAVYHSHVLEHMPKRFAPVFIKECYRVIKIGGIIRVVVPDLEQIVIAYTNALQKSLVGDKEAQKQYDWMMIELFDQMVRNQSGGEMLQYWKLNPMPAEEFVIDRCGSEVKDVLKHIRISPHDNSAIEDIYLTAIHNNDPSLLMKIAMFRISGEVHQWMYDRYSLMTLLKNAGFSSIRTCQANESEIPDFNRYLLDTEPDGSVRKPYSLFMEARK